MKYKSLLLDVDGTLVPVGPHTQPSERVQKALEEARKHVSVSLVSGRSLEWLIDLFETLDLTDPCIINGGSQIIDPKTRKILWERPIRRRSLDDILNIIRSGNIPFIVSDDGIEYKDPTNWQFEKPLAIKLTYFDSKAVSDMCLQKLSRIADISAHKVYSWDKERNYNLEIYITHKEASKHHAAHELANILKVSPHEMIGVGDARNDAPLLDICGLKIAMGNADDKLKAMAHHVVPTVDEDGVAYVVERFILA